MFGFLKSVSPREWVFIGAAVSATVLVEFTPWDRLWPSPAQPPLAAGPACPAVRGTGYAPLMFGDGATTDGFRGDRPPVARDRPIVRCARR